MLKKVAYAFGVLALLAGIWGFYNRFVFGHQDAAYGSYVVWGLWVAMYLFFAGTAVGGFMIATLDLLFRVPVFRGTGKIALWGALISLAAALVSVDHRFDRRWSDIGFDERDHAVDGFDGSAQKAGQAL